MIESLGRRLRRERERRGISLSSVSAETKISAALFEALERDDVTHWPPGIFRRSFLRAYANAIGVDAEAVVDEFLERFPEAAGAKSEETRPFDRQLSAAPMRLTLADEDSLVSGFRLASKIRRSWKGVAADLAVLLAIAACSSAAFGEFWMELAAASLIYYAGGVLLLGNTPGVIFFEPKTARQEPGHLRLLVGNAPAPEDAEDQVQDLVLNLEASEDTAEPTRRAVG